MATKKKTLTKTELVNNFLFVHPALDFWNENAIVSIGGKWLQTYDDQSVEFTVSPLCIMTNGENFFYKNSELAERKLFYQGCLDVPVGRWDLEDAKDYKANPRSVTVPEIFRTIKNEYQYYIDVVNESIYDVLTCFTIYTYFYPLFENAPILQFWGEFQTGKTKLCSLLEAMVFNPINSSNISGSTIFRQVQASRATILLDESEDLTNSEKGKEIRNMLLAGTGKSGKAYRQEKTINDNFRTSTFDVFSPKVIANITGISIPALQSRVIRIATIGTPDKEKSSRDVQQEATHWQLIRNQLYRITLQKYPDVVTVRDTLDPNGFSGRTLQLWKGIFSIAQLAGPDVYESICTYASDNKCYIESETEEMEERPRALIKGLCAIKKDNPDLNFYTPGYLLDRLRAYDVSFNSKRDLGLALGRLGLNSRTITFEGVPGRYYEITESYVNLLATSRSLTY